MLFRSVMAVVIESDGKNTLHESVQPHGDLDNLTPDEIIDIIREAGIVGMGVRTLRQKLGEAGNLMRSSLPFCMKIFTSLTLCSSSAISSIKYFYALVELSPQGRKYFISLYFPDTFIFHFPVKHKKHRPRGNRFVRKNSVLSAPSGVRTLDTLIKSQVLYQLS